MDSCACEPRETTVTDGDCGCTGSYLPDTGPHPGVQLPLAAATRNVTGDPNASPWSATTPGVHRSPALPGVGGVPELADPSLAIAGDLVDIYFSAGEVGADRTSPDYRSCDLDHMGNCSIWRVRWDLANMRAIDHELIREALPPFPPRSIVDWVSSSPNGVGFVEPALSPNGNRLAYVAMAVDGIDPNTSNMNVTGKALILHNLQTEMWQVADRPPGDLNPSWPEWLSNDEVYFNTSRNGSTIWKTSWSDPRTVTGVIGPDFDPADAEYQNPRIHQNPGYSGAPGKRMVTFADHGTGLKPRVTMVSGAFGEEFGLLDSDFKECHHPDWNSAGTEVVCCRYQDATIPEGTYAEQPLHRFTPGTGVFPWVNAGELFTSIPEADLQATMGSNGGVPLFPIYDALPSATSPSCRMRVWKYAQWCKSDRYLVATLFCRDEGLLSVASLGFGIFTSRIVIIDIVDAANPVVVDVTAELERRLNITTPGTYHGIFVTCGTP